MKEKLCVIDHKTLQLLVIKHNNSDEDNLYDVLEMHSDSFYLIMILYNNISQVNKHIILIKC